MLMTVDELTTMPGDKCILQLRGLHPFLSPKYDLKKHPNYKNTAEADKKRNGFDMSTLFTRQMKPDPDELYTVIEVDATEEDNSTGADATEDKLNLDLNEDIFNYDDLDDPEVFA